jgi:hypothetical protein
VAVGFRFRIAEEPATTQLNISRERVGYEALLRESFCSDVEVRLEKSLFGTDPGLRSEQGGGPNGNRTRVTALKGRCLDLLTMGPRQSRL